MICIDVAGPVQQSTPHTKPRSWKRVPNTPARNHGRCSDSIQLPPFRILSDSFFFSIRTHFKVSSSRELGRRAIYRTHPGIRRDAVDRLEAQVRR